jgi:hypothetical protein
MILEKAYFIALFVLVISALLYLAYIVDYKKEELKLCDKKGGHLVEVKNDSWRTKYICVGELK